MSENKLFLGIIGIEALWVLYLVVLLFPKPLYQEIAARDFYGTGERELNYTENGVGYLGLESDVQENTEAELLLSYDNLALRAGAYEMTAWYEADYDGQHNMQNVLGCITIGSEKNGSALKASSMILRDGSSKETVRMWMRPGGNPDDLRLNVYYYRVGNLLLNSVTIKENVLYRFVRLVGWLILFGLLDLLYLCFAKNTFFCVKEETKWKTLGLGGVILLSGLTCFTDFVFDGHDINFHLQRIYYLAESIRDMQIPQRVAFRAINGYGYATSLLYGDLFLYVPAVLYCLMLPLYTCYQLYVMGINTITCLISYNCFKRVCNDWKLGVTGAWAYTFSAYRMTNLLTRAAVGEYTAMAFFPLVCYGFYQIYSKKKEEAIRISDSMPLVVGLTGIVQSHVLSTEMVMFFLVIAALIFWKKTFERARFLAIVKAAVLTILCNLWFIYPYAVTYLSGKMGAQTLDANIERLKVYPIQLFGDFSPSVTGGATIDSMLKEMPLTLGITLILGLVLYLVCVVRREKWELEKNAYYKQAGIYAALAAVAIFMASSLFWSDNLTNRWRIAAVFIGALQFMWRMMAPATVFLSFLSVLCLAILREKKGNLYCYAAAAILLAPGILSTWTYMTDYADAAEELKVYQIQDPVMVDEIAPWFQLKDSNNYLAYKKMPLVGEGVNVSSEVLYEKGSYTVDCVNGSGNPSYIVLPVYNYDHFHAYDKEQMFEMDIETGGNNQVMVILPPNYDGTLLLKYEVPLSWRICEAVSLFTVLLTAFFLWKTRRLDRKCYIIYTQEKQEVDR